MAAVDQDVWVCPTCRTVTRGPARKRRAAQRRCAQRHHEPPQQPATRQGPCADCGEPYQPTHDWNTEGRTVRHPFRQAPPDALVIPAPPPLARRTR